MFGISTIRQFFLGRKFLFGITAGFADRSTFHVTGAKVSVGKSIIRKLSECEPWSDHVREGAMKDIADALNKGEFETAHYLLAFGSKENANPLCLKLLEIAIELCAADTDFAYDLSAFYKDELEL